MENGCGHLRAAEMADRNFTFTGAIPVIARDTCSLDPRATCSRRLPLLDGKPFSLFDCNEANRTPD